MKPQFLALLAALAWGFGGYFEKKGLQLGHLSPQVGITLRTAVALVILALISLAHLKTLGQAGTKSLLYLIAGGGVLAGSVGMLCFYAALKSGSIGQVMPIAFTAPLFGALMGLALGGEVLTWKMATGSLLTVSGIVLLTAR